MVGRPGRELRCPVLRFARREPSAVLLVVQLAAVLLYPFMEDSDVGRALFSVVGIGVLGLVLLAVRSTQPGPGSGSCWRSRPRSCC